MYNVDIVDQLILEVYMKRILIVLVLAVVLVMSLAAMAPAQVEGPEVVEAQDPFDALFLLLGFPVLGTVAAALVNVGKSLKLIKDGAAPLWRALISIVILGVLYGFKIIAPGVLETYGGSIESGASAFLGALDVILQILLMIFGSAVSHNYALKGIPVIGRSYSEAVG